MLWKKIKEKTKNLAQDLKTRFGTVYELLALLWQLKLWWLIPMVLMLSVVGFLLLFSQASSIAPFIYTLF